MGAGGSRQQIGERIKAVRRKIDENETKVDEQFKSLSATSPETLVNMVESIEHALTSFSPFPESVLLLALQADPERIEPALSKCTKRVLSAPIVREQYEWFKKYLFGSTVWFKKTKSGKCLYEDMMSIAVGAQEKITENMDSVYDHLTKHSKWTECQSVQNQTVISRQDDEAVGLLRESGIRDITEAKESDDSDGLSIDNLKTFIDNNLAINILMTTAKRIDGEFQREMKTILSRHGDFKPGPMKKVERAQSKLENDYMNEQYPKAAKLLDIVRCSVAYNTLGQLLDGYNAFMRHIQSGISSMTMARVKNGFLDEHDGGYRDIKVNVVYQSTLNPELKMVCEVQFILNQYLFEKKKVHKLYSIAREQTYFDLVVSEEDAKGAQQRRNLKALKFEPVLNVGSDVELNNEALNFWKSSVETDLSLLGMNGGIHDVDPDTFFCVNMNDNKLIFSHSAAGRYSHHWITINDQKYLSLQTTKNTISMFKVSDDRQFEEDESMKITLGDDDTINFCEYDKSFEHIYIVRNRTILEQRALSDLNTVAMSIELENRIGDSVSKLMALSDDGKYCAIASGSASGSSVEGFFYIISLETQEQFKATSQRLSNTYAPSFINGESELVAAGGYDDEGVEVWSVSEKKMVHHISVDASTRFIVCSYSANGILAVGLTPKVGKELLQLYDVSTWDMIYNHGFNMLPRSLYLTADCKYLVTGGSKSMGYPEKCVVFNIQ